MSAITTILGERSSRQRRRAAITVIAAVLAALSTWAVQSGSVAVGAPLSIATGDRPGVTGGVVTTAAPAAAPAGTAQPASSTPEGSADALASPADHVEAPDTVPSAQSWQWVLPIAVAVGLVLLAAGLWVAWRRRRRFDRDSLEP